MEGAVGLHFSPNGKKILRKFTANSPLGFAKFQADCRSAKIHRKFIRKFTVKFTEDHADGFPSVSRAATRARDADGGAAAGAPLRHLHPWRGPLRPPDSSRACDAVAFGKKLRRPPEFAARRRLCSAASSRREQKKILERNSLVQPAGPPSLRPAGARGAWACATRGAICETPVGPVGPCGEKKSAGALAL